MHVSLGCHITQRRYRLHEFVHIRTHSPFYDHRYRTARRNTNAIQWILNSERLLPKIVQHCESFIMKYSGHYIILSWQFNDSVLLVCDVRMAWTFVMCCYCVCVRMWQSEMTLDSGTINETHEYILKDISINSRSKSKLYCTRSDADNVRAFVQPIQCTVSLVGIAIGKPAKHTLSMSKPCKYSQAQRMCDATPNAFN